MKTLFIAFIFGIATIKTYSQKLDTLKLFYEIDKSSLDSHHKQKLDSLLGHLQNKQLPIRIKGYADFLWKPDYNLALSEQRAALAGNYFADRGFKNISIEGKGQIAAGLKAHNRLGEPFNRRVEIITPYVKATNLVEPKDPVETASKPETIVTYTTKPLSEAIAGESIVLEGLTFLPGRHVLRPEALPVLETLLGAMKEARGLKIEIQGHVCCTPSGLDERDIDTNERTLSVNRAKTVYNYLLENGIAATRMMFKGYGGSQPKISPEVTEEDKIQNRRVEIMIVENKK